MILTIEIDQDLFSNIDEEIRAEATIVKREDKSYPYHEDKLWVRLKRKSVEAYYRQEIYQIYLYNLTVTELDEGQLCVDHFLQLKKEANKCYKELKKREHFIKQENGDL